MVFAIESHQFAARDFIGGDAALDFVNTVTGRDQQPRDWLDGYARLLEWATLVRLLPEKNLRALTKKLQSEPTAAARALTRAKELREELFALVSAVASGNAPPKSALAKLREHWLAGSEAHELRFESGQVVADIRADAADLDLIAAMVAYRMVEHVMPQPVERLRMCGGENCSWVFLDSSKAGRRRWCDMAVCGNVAKAQRFYARTRKKAKG
ncbi:MAG TPA: CGNR zinc finger domain-containing protein [Steroidobacteraceae bacterium]|nr:CGNR zinc finger domain-containing protein [Steroidobacteraceae bacterium]